MVCRAYVVMGHALCAVPSRRPHAADVPELIRQEGHTVMPSSSAVPHRNSVPLCVRTGISMLKWTLPE